MSVQLLKLACPSCGASFQVSKDSVHFVCAHCGSQYALSHRAGAIEIKPIIEHLEQIGTTTAATAEQTTKVALELELTRLEGEVARLDNAANQFIIWSTGDAIVVGGLAMILMQGIRGFSGCSILLVLATGLVWLVLQATMGRAANRKVWEVKDRIIEIRSQLGI